MNFLKPILKPQNKYLKTFVVIKTYLNNPSVTCKRHISQTPLRFVFYEKDRRGSGYHVYPMDAKPMHEHLRDGSILLIQECKRFVEEVKEHFRNDPKFYSDGDTDVFFRFDKKECLENWVISSDKIHKEGKSECKLVINDRGKGVFYGTVDTTPPKDGKNRFAGYCSMKSLRKTKSFYRMDCYDWTAFTHLELRVRGDGRNYMLNLGMGMYFDLQWFDMYTYTIHTHGGPYWQTVKIPFSKFFLAAKGRLPDEQYEIPLQKVDSVGITCAGVSGPFQLEIDYIGCHVDYSHTEKFAYELYKIPKEIVSA